MDFFCTQSRLDLLHSVAQSWIGTPFHPNAMIKGRGVSCQMLVAAILIECGHLRCEEVPSAPMNWHGEYSIIERELDVVHRKQFKPIFGESAGEGLSHPQSPPAVLPAIQAGDVLGFRLHKTVHHCGIAVSSDLFLHVLRHSHVSVMPIDDAAWISRLKRIWRPIE
jgi:hypothetical protein